MVYVADTHSLAWYLADDNRLGDSAKKIFQNADEGKELIVIPIIVLAEMLYMSEKKKAGGLYKELLEKIRGSTSYLIYNFDLKVLLEVEKLQKIPELHDRMIVATAQLIKAKILTKDISIKESGYAEVIW